MNATLKLENELIETKLNEGKNGLTFLLEHADPDDYDKYDFLIKSAGVDFQIDDTDQLDTFIRDSFHMDPDEFYDKYEVNFWISRAANLAMLSESIRNDGDAERSHIIELYAEAFL